MTQLFSALSLLAWLIAAPSFAQDTVSSLTERNIESFIQKTSALTQQNNGLSDDDITRFLEIHLDENGIYKSVITYNIPGFPPQPKKMILNKTQFIENVVQGRNALRDYSSRTQIKGQKIEADGTKAKIQTTAHENGKMPLQGQELVPYEGISDCIQHLKLSEEGHIQLVSAECETNFNILSF